jgi:hypothetical protein
MESFFSSSRRVVYGIALLIVVAGAVGSVFAAQQRALTAEEVYVSNQLANKSCLSDWGINEGVGVGEGSTTGVTVGGVRVAVTLPYAYTTETDEGTVYADSISHAVYAVTATDVHRISGDRISIC